MTTSEDCSGSKKKAFGGIAIFFIVWCLVSSGIFYAIERDARTSQNVNEVFTKVYDNITSALRAGYLGSVTKAETLENTSIQVTYERMNDNEEWSYPAALYFVSTTVTTIGYGNVYPITAWGKMFCILIALVGIPCLIILLSGLAAVFRCLISTYRARIFGEAVTRISQLLQVLATTALGLVFFILLPAVMFSVQEGWSYGDSIYFSFISLLTIGFGDLIPGPNHWYRLLHTIWIFTGLAYFTVVVAVIQETLAATVCKDKKTEVAVEIS